MRRSFAHVPPELAMPRATRFVALVLLATLALLGACASPEPGRLALPPNASVQRLDYDAQGRINVTFRVQNYGPKPVHYGDLTLKLVLGGSEAGEFAMPLGFDIAGHSSEVVQGSIQGSPAALESLRAAEQRAGAIGSGTVSYHIEGTIVAEKPKGTFPIHYEGRLSPEPGLAHHFR
jgi:hypothetical protein